MPCSEEVGIRLALLGRAEYIAALHDGKRPGRGSAVAAVEAQRDYEAALTEQPQNPERVKEVRAARDAALARLTGDTATDR